MRGQSTEIKDRFVQEMLRSVPRLLSLLDRNPASPTYGCFDRDYWHYQLAADFPGSTWQSGVLTLVYAYQWPESRYYHNAQLKEWIRAGLSYWGSIQHSDGSFDEWYPQEHSHVATAFTSAAIVETLRLLPDLLESTPGLKKRLHKAAEWLEKNHDFKVCNHAAGAVCALHGVGELLGEERFQQAAEKQCALLSDLQSKEGWLPEYHGADAGYTSVSLDYLAAYHKRSGNPLAQEMVRRLADFLEWFVFPDGTSGGTFTSRNTGYLFPRGLIIASAYSESARRILKRWIAGWKAERIITPETMDDRYAVFFLLPNWGGCAECLEERDLSFEMRTPAPNGLRHFSHAGLLVYRNEEKKIEWVIGLSKNGAMTAYRDGERCFVDSGYAIKLTGGGTAVSQAASVNRVTVEAGGTEAPERIRITSPFILKKEAQPFAKWGICFRLVTSFLSFCPALAVPFSRLVKAVGVTGKNRVPIYLERTITLSEKGERVVIEDRLNRSGFLRIDSVSLSPIASWLHVPSSRYFYPAEARAVQSDLAGEEEKLSRLFRGQRKIEFRRDAAF